jgi:hypothetical protein
MRPKRVVIRRLPETNQDLASLSASRESMTLPKGSLRKSIVLGNSREPPVFTSSGRTRAEAKGIWSRGTAQKRLPPGVTRTS